MTMTASPTSVPTLSISTSETILTEGGSSTQVVIRTDAPSTTGFGVNFQLTGSASFKSVGLFSSGEGAFTNIALKAGEEVIGYRSVGEGATAALYAVMRVNTTATPPGGYTPSPDTSFRIVKLDSSGQPASGFPVDGVSISLPNAGPQANEGLIFGEAGFAVLRSGSAQFYGPDGAPQGQGVTLPSYDMMNNGSPVILGLSDQGLLMAVDTTQDADWRARDLVVMKSDGSTQTFEDVFDVSIPTGSGGQSGSPTGSEWLKQNTQVVLTDEGVLAWRDGDNFKVFDASDTAPAVETFTGPTGLGSPIISNGKLYFLETTYPAGSTPPTPPSSQSVKVFDPANPGAAGAASLQTIAVPSLAGMQTGGAPIDLASTPILLGVSEGSLLLGAPSSLTSGAGDSHVRVRVLLSEDGTSASIDPNYGVGGWSLHPGYPSSVGSGSWQGLDVAFADRYLSDITQNSGDIAMAPADNNYRMFWLNSDGRGGFSFNPGEQEAVFDLTALFDALSEPTENLSIELLPSTMAGSTGGYVVSSDSNKVDFSIDNASVAQPSMIDKVDLNGPEETGSMYYNAGPFYFHPNGSGPNISSYTLGKPNFYDATLEPGVALQGFKISVSKAGIPTDPALGLDFMLGWDRFTPPSEMYPAGSAWDIRPYAQPNTLNYAYDTRIPLGDTVNAYFVREWLAGQEQVFKIQQVDTGPSIELRVTTASGEAISSEAMQQLLRNIGLGYEDPSAAQSVQHDFAVNLSVSVTEDGVSWNTPSDPSAASAQFYYQNEAPEPVAMHAADKFVEIFLRSGDPASANFDLVESSTNEYDQWRGTADPSLFSILVNGTDTSYFVEEVIQTNTVVLVLNKSLEAGDAVSVNYDDPDGNQFRFVVENFVGVDATDFTVDATAMGLPAVGAFTEKVLSGAFKGWNSGEAEDAYLSGDWGDNINAIVKEQLPGGRYLLSFEPLPWGANPHFNPSSTIAAEQDPYAALRIDIIMQPGESAGATSPWTIGSPVPFGELLDPASGHLAFSFTSSLLTADSSAPSSASISVHPLAEYGMPTGVPLYTVVSDHVGGFRSTGSAFDDVLGNPFSLFANEINAGDGSDTLFSGVGNDLINGGKGTDTLVLFGNQSDYEVTRLSSNSFQVTTGPSLLTAEALLRTGTDTLVSVEQIQFDDRLVELGSEDPGFGNTSVTKLAGQQQVVAPSAAVDYLDLRGVLGASPAAGASYTLEADFGLNDGLITVVDGLGYGSTYAFSGFEGFILDGTLGRNVDANPISVYASAFENDFVLVSGGHGLVIDLGNGDPDEFRTTTQSQEDVLSFRGTEAGVSIDLSNPGTADQLDDAFSDVRFTAFGGESIVVGADIVLGSETRDVITGYQSRENLLAGYGGNDTLTGGDKSDLIFGGAGSDTITAGAGDDIIVDLDSATITGGAGKDIFVIRGAGADTVTITDFELSETGLSRGGLNSTSYADRIAFNFSTAALASAFTGIAPSSGFALDAAGYQALRNAIRLTVDDPATASGSYTMRAEVQNDGAWQEVGRAQFSLASSALGDDEGIRAVKLAQDFGFLEAFSDTVMQQLLAKQSIMEAMLAPGAAPDFEKSDAETIFTDTVTLYVALEKTNKYTVGPTPGSAAPIYVPVVIEGIEYATTYQPGNIDEKLIGGRKGDTYQYIKSEFIDENGVSETNQSFGSDIVMERGGRQQSAADGMLDADRDAFSLVGGNTGISIEDFILGDLDLTRVQTGREGAGMSLEVAYSGEKLNTLNTTIYKQYTPGDSTYRVEDLVLLDGVVDPETGTETGLRFDLGESQRNEITFETELKTFDGRDAILLSRAGRKDTFVLENTPAAADKSSNFEVYFKDFDHDMDSIELRGYGLFDYSSIAGFEFENVSRTVDGVSQDLGDKITVTTDTGFDISLIFIGSNQSIDDWKQVIS